MPPENLALLAALVLIIGLLYSSVGHAGASGYLAAMTLVGMSADDKKPTSLILNILVSIIGTVQFARAGHFDWRLFWPFAATSVPLAYLGGLIKLPPEYYNLILGVVLLFSAWRIAAASSRRGAASEAPTYPPPIPLALCSGAILGFISGLTGVGGGIFLSPLLLLCRWADPKRTAAVSALFILVNSISGIAGWLSQKSAAVPAASLLLPLAAAAIIGGLIGSYLGARKLNPRVIRRVLAVVLIIAGGKLVWEGVELFSKKSPTRNSARIRVHPRSSAAEGGSTPRSPTSADPAA